MKVVSSPVFLGGVIFDWDARLGAVRFDWDARLGAVRFDWGGERSEAMRRAITAWSRPRSLIDVFERDRGGEGVRGGRGVIGYDSQRV